MQQSPNIHKAEEIVRLTAFVRTLQDELAKVVIGQTTLIERLLVALIANGHVLVEGVPGLAKTTIVKALAQSIDAQFARIQFTPDLLPSDLVGTQVFNPKTADFGTKKGPIFANIILADEINRAPSKVQSALLEAMQEHQVTIGGESFDLPTPFFVLATQNPIEQEGTYPLPEAQIDRFMMKIKITYPSREEEKTIMQRMSQHSTPSTRAVVQPAQIVKTQELLDDVYVDEKVADYILDLVLATREPGRFKLDLAGLIQYGASPRASIYLNRASRAMALLRGRGFVTPQDVKTIYPDIVRHRIILSYEAEAEGMSSEKIIEKILDRIDVP